MLLRVIIASTRPGRVGLPVGKWFTEHAQQHAKFDVELTDLSEVNLPLLDEPSHPRLHQYQNEHTKRWSALVQSGDAYVFVLPEYNFNPPATFINAVDYVYTEWNYKAAGLVTYGGVSGGLRCAQMAKQILTAVKVMPMVEAVAIPFVSKFLGDEGEFKPDELHAKAADTMLDELHRWSEALQTLRSDRIQ
jgi:NAD(P)H-dependent FMN reductase